MVWRILFHWCLLNIVYCPSFQIFVPSTFHILFHAHLSIANLFWSSQLRCFAVPPTFKVIEPWATLRLSLGHLWAIMGPSLGCLWAVLRLLFSCSWTSLSFPLVLIVFMICTITSLWEGWQLRGYYSLLYKLTVKYFHAWVLYAEWVGLAHSRNQPAMQEELQGQLSKQLHSLFLSLLQHIYAW